ncbi:MAG: RNA polymerase sigma factor, partial [Candidatus Hydrogenedentota bacterium]
MLPTSLSTDKRLVRHTLAGRPEAFNVLVERHIHLVQALAYAQTGNYADAQDATQETFIKAYQALDTLREPAKFAAWLSTIARRVCWEFKRDAHRRRNREQAAHDEERVTTADM